jgi:hypothetical protein
MCLRSSTENDPELAAVDGEWLEVAKTEEPE